jgi:hypothetical protein
MKLKEYIETKHLFANNYITLLDIEAMFKHIATHNSSYFYDNLGLNTDINNYKSDVKYILSSNPDCDFPRPKNDIMHHHDKSYNAELQNALDNMYYKEKIDINQLNGIPEHIQKIFCHSVGIHHEKVIMIPIGRDFKNARFFNNVESFNKTDKKYLCYYNCTLPPNSIHWYGFIRRHIYNFCMTKTFISCEHCNVHPRTYNTDLTLNYYAKLANSKFMICPRGCGIDTYRLWDCIYMGCIPIVEKYEGYKQFEDLPILFIDHWKEINYLTDTFLEHKWNEMLEINYNYKKLKLSYWKELILNI